MSRHGSARCPKGCVGRGFLVIDGDTIRLGRERIRILNIYGPELRSRMYAELAQFVAPKLKAIEHSGDSERTYVARLPEPEPDLDKWQQQHELHAAPNGSGVANGNGSAH